MSKLITLNIYNKNNNNASQNKKTFHETQRKLNLKNWIILCFLISLSLLLLSFIVTLSSNGFKDANLLWRINYKLLFIIPIASFGLGVSSYLIQQMSNNRLGDTSILGIGNVNLIAMMLLILAVDFNSTYAVNNYKNIFPFLFIIVSMITSLLIYLLSYNKRKNISKKFIISGIVLNFTFIGISYAINTFLPSGKAAVVKSFSTGFLDSSEDLTILVAIISFTIAMVWLALVYEKFKIATINNEVARGLGINTNNIYLQILLISGMLTGISYILVGNVVFLGMLAGNIAFNLYKKKYNFSIISSGLSATIILSLAYLVNSNLLSTTINTTSLIPLVGIPYFLYLVFKE